MASIALLREQKRACKQAIFPFESFRIVSSLSEEVAWGDGWMDVVKSDGSDRIFNGSGVEGAREGEVDVVSWWLGKRKIHEL